MLIISICVFRTVQRNLMLTLDDTATKCLQMTNWIAIFPLDCVPERDVNVQN